MDPRNIDDVMEYLPKFREIVQKSMIPFEESHLHVEYRAENHDHHGIQYWLTCYGIWNRTDISGIEVGDHVLFRMWRDPAEFGMDTEFTVEIKQKTLPGRAYMMEPEDWIILLNKNYSYSEPLDDCTLYQSGAVGYCIFKKEVFLEE